MKTVYLKNSKFFKYIFNYNFNWFDRNKFQKTILKMKMYKN